MFGHEAIGFDVCRAIVGCHSANIVFLSDEERVALERDFKYKERLAENVKNNIRLRAYGSVFFRKQPILSGDVFLTYNVPYDIFVMAVRIGELLRKSKIDSGLFTLYCFISNNALAVLSLLEDNFLDNCYTICRTIIELYIKLLILKDYPKIAVEYEKFRKFEIKQACCEQQYSEDFNKIYKERENKSNTRKDEYLHYGWVDKIPDYHVVVKYRPYSANGVLNYLRKKQKVEGVVFENLEKYYKMCHGYAHGNAIRALYPLLHYFEISIILFFTITNTYKLICDDVQTDTKISGVDIVIKTENDFALLIQYI